MLLLLASAEIRCTNNIDIAMEIITLFLKVSLDPVIATTAGSKRICMSLIVNYLYQNKDSPS